MSKLYRARGSALRRTFVRVLSGVDLAAFPSQTVCLIGETGSGKTTLGRVLVGLTQPEEGSVSFRGRSITSLRGADWREYRRSVQMVFQNPTASFNPMLTVGASIRDALRFAPHPDGRTGTDVARLLEQVELSPRLADRYPDEVSGGELQRASIARALATEPSLIFLDEPASALDVSIRGQIFNLLRALQQERGLALVMVTHDMPTVRVMGDDVLVLYLGRTAEYARHRTFAAPRHPYSLALLAASSAEASRRGLHSLRLLSEVPSVSDPPTGCPFHPRCWLYRRLGEPERCRVEIPQPSPVENGHDVACHFANQSLEAATGPMSRAPEPSQEEDRGEP